MASVPDDTPSTSRWRNAGLLLRRGWMHPASPLAAETTVTLEKHEKSECSVSSDSGATCDLPSDLHGNTSGVHKQTDPPAQRILTTPLIHVVWQRLSVLVSLLLLQSLSQFVLEAYEGLITTNVVVPLFLTMLVGAGGNAGNQAAVHAITGLVTGELRPGHIWSLLKRELLVGFISSCCLFCIGFVRVFLYYTNEDVQPTPVLTTVFCISVSLFFIVLVSVVLGSALPFALRGLKLDIEHAAPMIQVLMDILGVFIACTVCAAFLPSEPIPTNAPPQGIQR